MALLKATYYSCPQDLFTYYGYTRDRVLGRGMMGQVILAKASDGSNQPLKAVKTFSKKTRDDGRKNYTMFQKELAILQAVHVKHEHIMGNIEAFECPDEYVLCMPYYKKGTLKTRLTSMTMNLTDKYLMQLTSAVLYLHKRHLVHRDIKPDNILISDDGNVILTDFGLACGVSSKPNSDLPICGTRGYMAPELRDPGQKTINLYKCDAYSLGVVLWNMLFRQVGTPNPLDYLIRIKTEFYIPLLHKTILENLLHQDSCHRWDCRELNCALAFVDMNNSL